MPFYLLVIKVAMDKRTKLFSNTLNALEQNIAKPTADASSESASLGYRSPETVGLGSAVGLISGVHRVGRGCRGNFPAPFAKRR